MKIGLTLFAPQHSHTTLCNFFAIFPVDLAMVNRKDILILLLAFIHGYIVNSRLLTRTNGREEKSENNIEDKSFRFVGN